MSRPRGWVWAIPLTFIVSPICPEEHSMALTADEVRYIARLARVGVTEEEIDRFREQLSNILENFEVLQQVNTDNVPPTAQAIPLKNVMAADEVQPPLTQDEVLANAPRRENGFFKIRAVLEE